MTEEPFLKRKSFFMSMGDKTMQEYVKVREKTIWTDSSGNDRMVWQMDSNYIKNCMNKIKRGEFVPDRDRYIPLFENELIYRQINKQ
jgi:hypothetical protein